MKKILLSTFLIFVSVMMYAQKPFTINLLTKERFVPPVEGQFTTSEEGYIPYIQVYLPDQLQATGRAVLICPGGGYVGLAMQHEGIAWADYFNNQGIAVIVLKYRMPKEDYTIPLADAEAGLQLVKDNAKDWHINPSDVGIMGFSAGGHLASTVATHTKDPLKPNFQILFYPVITMDKTFTHNGSRTNLLGKDVSEELETLFSNEKQVTADTPPAIIISSANDDTVPIANSLRYFEALQRNKVYTALHVYPIGGHGWGYKPDFAYNSVILKEISTWLQQL